MVSVLLGWELVFAPNSFGGAGPGARGGAQQFRLCWCERQGRRPMASVARGRAPRVAPNNFGDVGPGAGVGA